MCECLKNHFAKDGQCKMKKKVGDDCLMTTECVDNAVCSVTTQKCLCVDGYFQDQGFCAGSE